MNLIEKMTLNSSQFHHLTLAVKIGSNPKMLKIDLGFEAQINIIPSDMIRQ